MYHLCTDVQCFTPSAGPSPPAHHPELCHMVFTALAFSTSLASFRRSRCRSECPFVVAATEFDGEADSEKEANVGGEVVVDDSDAVTGDEDRGVDEGEEANDVALEDNMGGRTPRIRPAAKTQPPTACLINESPARLPIMKTLLATSSDVSDLVRSVCPDIRVGVVESEDVPKTSARSWGERKSSVPRRPMTYCSPPTFLVIMSPDARRMVT
jgi:hypothetical protein